MMKTRAHILPGQIERPDAETPGKMRRTSFKFKFSTSFSASRRLGVLFVLFLAICTVVASNARAESISGDFVLPDKPADTVQLHFGDKVKAACTISATQFFKMHCLTAMFDLQNTNIWPMYYSLNIAFFDADHNLIACLKTGSTGGPPSALQASEHKTNASDTTPIPLDDLKKIKYYQATWHEAHDPAEL
jgi:hypothetical protein